MKPKANELKIVADIQLRNVHVYIIAIITPSAIRCG